MKAEQGVEKRSERSQDKAKMGEKPECTLTVYRYATPDFEPIFNAVLASAVVFRHSVMD